MLSISKVSVEEYINRALIKINGNLEKAYSYGDRFLFILSEK